MQYVKTGIPYLCSHGNAESRKQIIREYVNNTEIREHG